MKVSSISVNPFSRYQVGYYLRQWYVTRHGSTLTYVIETALTLTLTINEMKRFYKKVFKKKPSLGSTHGHGPATSTSTLMTSTTDLMPSIHGSDPTASAQVNAGISTVSVQLRLSHV